MDSLTRSPFDIQSPAPSEELLGLCHGILNSQPDVKVAFEALKLWLVTHIPKEALESMEARDPLWSPWAGPYCDPKVDKPAHFYNEWALRWKNCEALPPIPGTSYKPHLALKTRPSDD